VPKFLIEVPHDPGTLACARVVKVFLESGSHFLTHAEWGCMDNMHSAWMVVETDNKAEALAIVPPAFRGDTRIVRLTHFKLDDIERTIAKHQPSGGSKDARG
jgi:hypothetical protein